MIENQPQSIGKYRIDRLLGRGGMGHVYVGVDPDLEREVAIKIVSLDTDADSRARFLREAKTMARLNHPNIVTLLEFGVEGDKPYLVMELLGGVDLSEWMRMPHPLAAQLQVMRDIALAIQAAHEAGVLHRDIKPENVRVLPNGHCKLLDFGIANRADEGHLTASGSFVGTMNFVAPEVVSGLRHCEQSDIYSLGLLCYTMLAQHNPFNADSTAATLARVLQHTPPSLDRVRDGVPRELVALIDRCLSKNPLHRPPSAGLLAEVIASCVARLGADAALGPLRTDSGPQPLSNRELLALTRETPASGTERPRRAARFALVAAMIALAGVGVWVWRERTAPAIQADGGSAVAQPSAVATPAVVAAPSTPPSSEAGAPDVGVQSSPATPATESPQGVAAAKPTTAPLEIARAPHASSAAADDASSTRSSGKHTADSRDKPPVVSPTTTAALPPVSVPAPVPAAVAEHPAPAADAATHVVPDDTPAAPARNAQTTPPEIPPPSIAAGSPHLIRRGFQTTVILSGANLRSATAANVLQGTAADSRFQISDFHLHDDATLSLRIEVPRNLPLGRYPLVLESASGRSAPFMLEVSL